MRTSSHLFPIREHSYYLGEEYWVIVYNLGTLKIFGSQNVQERIVHTIDFTLCGAFTIDFLFV